MARLETAPGSAGMGRHSVRAALADAGSCAGRRLGGAQSGAPFGPDEAERRRSQASGTLRYWRPEGVFRVMALQLRGGLTPRGRPLATGRRAPRGAVVGSVAQILAGADGGGG